MTTRDELVKILQNEIASVGITNTTEKVVKVSLLAGVTKMVITGRTKYDITLWLNRQTRTLGWDVKHVATDVYNVIKEVDL